MDKPSQIFNPFAKKNDRQKVQAIGVFLLLSWTYQLITNWLFTWLMLTDTGPWDLSAFLYFFTLIATPIAGVALLKIKKIGWILLTILLVNMITGTISSLIFEIRWAISYDSGETTGLLGQLNESLGAVGIGQLIIKLIIVSLVLYFINLKRVLALFPVSNTARFITLGVAVGIFGSFYFSYFF